MHYTVESQLFAAWKIIFLVHDQLDRTIRSIPSGGKNQLCHTRCAWKQDLFDVVSGFVVILVDATKVKYHRHIVLREVVMVAAVIKPIGVIWRIKRVIQFQIPYDFIGILIRHMELRTQFVASNDIDILRFTFVRFIHATDHVDVEIAGGFVQWKNGVIGIIFGA